MFDDMDWRERKVLGRLGTDIRQAVRAEGGVAPRYMPAMVRFVAARLEISTQEVLDEPIGSFRAVRDLLTRPSEVVPGRLVSSVGRQPLAMDRLWGAAFARLEGTPTLMGLHNGKKRLQEP